jgi:hypothetical protein
MYHRHKLLDLMYGFKVLKAVAMKSSVFWDITRLVRWKLIDVLEDHIASIFMAEG